MRAMIFNEAGKPLQETEVPTPKPEPWQILIKVHACGVCRTDLHIVDGDLAQPKNNLIPGHEIVGIVVESGAQVTGFEAGQRIGVPWLGHTDGTCSFCQSGRENLCDHPQFTGYTVDGGYAEYAVADYRYCFPLPDGYSDAELAPMLCAGLIGYRSLRLAGEGKRLGLYGFGAAAHIVVQLARYQERQVFAFTRPGDAEGQKFAVSLGAHWAGGSDETPPEALDTAIIFAPIGSLIPAALRAVTKGGRVISAGIHMSDIPSFPYRILWEERSVASVANLTRRDGEEFFALVPKVPVSTSVRTFPLSQANEALAAVREGRVEGAAVLKIV
jgi:propanol-preferring alcohol dehydrogenase